MALPLQPSSSVFLYPSGSCLLLKQLTGHLASHHWLQWLSSMLYDLYIEIDWMALLNYHFAFHARCLTKTEGDYSHWSKIDGALQTQFLIGHPCIHLPRDKSMSSRPPLNITKQLCNDFNYRSCTHMKCPWIHKCKACDNSDHGYASCPNKSKSTWNAGRVRECFPSFNPHLQDEHLASSHYSTS